MNSAYNNFERLEELLAFLPEKCHFRIHQCYNLRVSERWGFEGRVNKDLHLIFVKGGKGVYDLWGRTEALEKGRVIFVSAGFRHGAATSPENRVNIIPFRFGLYSNLTGMEMPFPVRPFCISFKSFYHEKFGTLFEKLYRDAVVLEGGKRKISSNLIIQEILLKIFSREDDSSDTDRRIARIKEHISRNPHERKSLQQLAETVGLSPKYFAVLFKKHTGFSPVDYCIHARCERAKYLISHTNISIKETAAELGYPDQYSFSKQFRKFTGFSPSAFR